MSTLQQIMLLCRPGFESECAAELMQHATNAGFPTYINAKTGNGYAHLVFTQHHEAKALLGVVDFSELVFTRQWFVCTEKISNLPETNRTAPLVSIARQLGTHLHDDFSEIELDYADTNEGKTLNRFCTLFKPHLLTALKDQGLLSAHSKLRLHIFFLDSSSVWMGASPKDNAAHQEMGILRLRMPRSAPSRSTLKLEEAINWFFAEEEQKQRFKPGMHAVDLGAAPGGWSWQLVNRGLLVTAVDNGPMDKTLMDTGMVEHLRTDAFIYAPASSVDWLLCDMAERPLHVSRLIARWFKQRNCEAAIFNLKLPMKKRYQTVMDCKELLHQSLGKAGIDHRLQIKHLYHDREEVTACLITDDREAQH